MPKRRVEDRFINAKKTFAERVAPSGLTLEDHLGSINRNPQTRRDKTTNPIKNFADALVKRNKRNALLKNIKKNPQSEFSNPSRGRRVL